MNTRLGGRYQVVREIGRGGMGRVFQAIDADTGRSVAAKVLIATGEADLQALLRFQQEGAVLSTLKHPNIVQVYGTFLEDQTCAIIMELLEGQSLAEMLRQGGVPLQRIKHLVEQVASALVYAHGHGIVHRDIKPDNIMVVGGDQVKVTDFGIARIVGGGGGLHTLTGLSLGTPLYMAPEQIRGQMVDGRTDIYALGAVMYQMVTGRPPFEGGDPLSIAFKHVHEAPDPPRRVSAAVPPDWEALILKALAKDPADRFQTAAELRDAIGRLNPGHGVIPVSAAPVTPPPSPPPPVVDRTAIVPVEERPTPPARALPPTSRPPTGSGGSANWWWWAVPLVLVALLAGGGLAFALTRSSQSAGPPATSTSAPPPATATAGAPTSSTSQPTAPPATPPLALASPTSAPATAAGPTPTLAPPTAAPTVDPVAHNVSVIRAKGYSPDSSQQAETSNGSGGTLYAYRATCTGSADGYCQMVFFFDGTHYLGTDTYAPSQQITGVVASGPQAIDVTYANYQKNDPLCCPSGQPVTITYRWTGARIVPSGTPPGH